jgi:phage-related protein (TIGR01555 family)
MAQPRSPKPKAKAAPTPRADGWDLINEGMSSVTRRDRSRSARPTVDVLDYSTLLALWRGDDMGARIAEQPPRDALRSELLVDVGDPEFSRTIRGKLDDLQLVPRLLEGLIQERVFGGAATLLVVDDGRSLDLPIDLSRIASVRALVHLEAQYLLPSRWDDDPLSPSFGKVLIWRTTPTGTGSIATEIHRDRLLIYPGIETTAQVRRERQGWGDSIFFRLWRVLQQWGTAVEGVGVLLGDKSKILKMRGLYELLGANDRATVEGRAASLFDLLSTYGIAIIDSEETLERFEASLTGVPDTLDRLTSRLAAAAGIPVTVLLGEAPAGLNATGDSDVRNYYDRLAADRTSKIVPLVERVTKLVLLSKTGPTQGTEPPMWSASFAPLWQPTPSEQADIEAKQAQTDKTLVEAKIRTVDEIRAHRGYTS